MGWSNHEDMVAKAKAAARTARMAVGALLATDGGLVSSEEREALEAAQAILERVAR